MPAPHINDDLLDQYALGTLPEERLAYVEEHLLVCEVCQSRLEVSDEFAMLFQAAAVQPDARPQRSWLAFWQHPAAIWSAAAAMLAILLLMAGPLHRPPMAPATVLMQSLRGPDAPAQIAGGRSALLIFDILPAAGGNGYEARIVNPVGVEILAPRVSSKDGHLAVLVDRLPPGSYWVRVSRTGSSEPIAEYGLRAK